MMSEYRWPVIDTNFKIGVNMRSTCVAEEDLIPYLDENGIDIQMVFQVDEGFTHHTPAWNPYIGNDYVAKIQNMFPDRVFGLATVCPWNDAPKTWNYPPCDAGKPFTLPVGNEATRELDRCILELGLKGLRMNPIEHNYELNNKDVVYPMLTRLTELQRETGKVLPVVVHGSGDSGNNTALQFACVADDFPELTFIMVHSGFIWCYGTTGEIAPSHPNLLLDLTGNLGPYSVIDAYRQCGASKFTIGTDGPLGVPAIKEKILDVFVGDNDEDRQLILGGNLAQRLGIGKIRVG